MRVPGLKSTRQVMRQFRSRLKGGAIILGYHRITEEVDDPFSMSVSPKNFAEQLDVIQNLAIPVPLDSLGEGVQISKLAKGMVTLTMDDGYADNLYNALPILENKDIPATIFVVTGLLGQEFWWDELVRLVFTKGVFTNGICLTIADQKYKLKLESGQNVQEQKEQFLWQVYRALRPSPILERQRTMEILRRQVGDVEAHGQKHCALSSTELRTMANCPLIEIGSHTHTHPALADITENEQQAEIKQSKQILEEIIERPINHFSYPNGSLSADTKLIVRKAGYLSACTSNADAVFHQSDRFALPRLWVRDWDGKQFNHWLKKWL